MTLEYMGLISLQYVQSKYFREDNTLDNAEYLRYLNAKELYPDFKPMTFREFLKDELLPGKSTKPYANVKLLTKWREQK
jgi:hypothetical protein